MKMLALLPFAALLALPGMAAAQAPLTEGGEVMFVSGAAVRLKADGTEGTVAKGMHVAEGDRIRTQKDSHVYVRLRDGGLLVVRPASELVVERWRYDPAHPEDSQIKYMLESGVARHVSGKAAKAARDKFRFNTPLAAIGVRGTDFTVLADQAVTRVAVRSGGVVVSGIGNGCRAEALGPCEGDSAVELFANANDRLLQVRQGERRPEVVEREKREAPAPDAVNPPAAVEPVAKVRSGDTDAQSESRTTVTVDKAVRAQANLELITGNNPGVAIPVLPPTAPTWGRFQAVADGTASATLEQVLNAGNQSRAVNEYYFLAAAPGRVEVPGAGTASFRLQGHDGVVVNTTTGKAVASTASEGKLTLDFGKRTFDTTLQVRAESIGFAHTVVGKGFVESNGYFAHDASRADGTVLEGQLGVGGNEAAYIYEKKLPDVRALGTTTWRK